MRYCKRSFNSLDCGAGNETRAARETKRVLNIKRVIFHMHPGVQIYPGAGLSAGLIAQGSKFRHETSTSSEDF